MIMGASPTNQSRGMSVPTTEVATAATTAQEASRSQALAIRARLTAASARVRLARSLNGEDDVSVKAGSDSAVSILNFG
jgi:hypothetical protein